VQNKEVVALSIQCSKSEFDPVSAQLWMGGVLLWENEDGMKEKRKTLEAQIMKARMNADERRDNSSR
jgi:hypothetical protein